MSPRLRVYPWILIAGWTVTTAVTVAAFGLMFNMTLREVTSEHALNQLRRDLAHLFAGDRHRMPSPRVTLAGAQVDINGRSRIIAGEGADPWEREALAAIHAGQELAVEPVVALDEVLHGRVMVPIVAREPCLACHSDARAGDVLAAATLAMPLSWYVDKMWRNFLVMSLATAALWALGVLGIVLGFRHFRRSVEERIALETQMQNVQKLESLGVLAGGIAHDFNNLLSGALGHAGLAKEALPDDSPARTDLDKVVRALQRSAELVRQMLAYSGRARIEITAVHLSDLVRDTAELVSASISKHAILHYQLADSLPTVDADATQLRQVVMNLISNASDALGDTSGNIRVTTSERALDEGSFVVLEVSDTGAGMDAGTHQRIFEPFYTTKESGRGLGLAAVLGIVKSHHGIINISSTPGEGTAFEVLLPAGQRVASTATPIPPATPSAGGTVLVVDDESVIRDMARAVLELHGWEVVDAADGIQALQVIAGRRDVVAVLLDLTMPGMGGGEVLTELRKQSPELPVVLSSGFDKDEIALRFADQEHLAFLQKPYLPEVLLSTLARVLS